MLTIDRLRLRLPPGYAHRAAAIARHVAEELARRPLSADEHRTRLNVPALEIPHGWSDRQVAAHIARHIHRQVDRDAMSRGSTGGSRC